MLLLNAPRALAVHGTAIPVVAGQPGGGAPSRGDGVRKITGHSAYGQNIQAVN